jgi:hypothetical protein
MLELIRRDTATIEVTITDTAGNAVDLTGCTVFFTVKKKPNQADASAVISKEVSVFDDPLLGIALINLSASDTDIVSGVYWYDVQLKKADGTIVSKVRDQIEIVQDITVRTT